MALSTKQIPLKRADWGKETVLSSVPARSPNRTQICVAVATKSGGIVNQHFGHAKEFHIYELDQSEAVLIEVRQVTPYCHGNNNEPGDLTPIVSTLQDCKAVLVSRIGVGPDDLLREAGIEPIQVYEVIETALFDFYETWSQANATAVEHEQSIKEMEQ